MRVEGDERLEELDLGELTERLAQVRATRTALGWRNEIAVTKSSLERRILELVCSPEDSEDSSVVTVEHEIEVEVQHKTIETEVASILPGGLWIPSAVDFQEGAHALIKIRTEDNYPLQVKGVVRHRVDHKDGIAIAFEHLDNASQRRVERLILELLKSQEL